MVVSPVRCAARQAAAHALSDHQRRGLKLSRDLVIGALIHHPGANCLALILRQPGQHILHPRVPLHQPIDATQALPTQLDHLEHPNPPARRILDAAASHARHQRVVRDRQQPRHRRRPARPVARRRIKRGREHLGGQIRRGLGIGDPPPEIAHEQRLVALVEPRERVGIGIRRRQ